MAKHSDDDGCHKKFSRLLNILWQPIGVSEFKIQEILPKEIASDLPSIAEIESEIERNVM